MKTQEKSQLKIYIDSSQRHEKKVSLIRVEEGTEKVLIERYGDIDIIGSIKDILEEKNLDLEDISEFVPNLGPGSFTGLKIGVTISNFFNWVLGKKKLEELDVPEYGGEPNISKPKREEPIGE